MSAWIPAAGLHCGKLSHIGTQRTCDKCHLVSLLPLAETHLPCAVTLLQRGYFLITANTQLGICSCYKKRTQAGAGSAPRGAPCRVQPVPKLLLLWQHLALPGSPVRKQPAVATGQVLLHMPTIETFAEFLKNNP